MNEERWPVSCADFATLSNLSEEGRARNRRVDLVILTQEAAAFGPA